MQFPSHRPRQIEFIQQRTKSDCGVACIAMLAGLLYESAHGLIGRPKGGLYPDDVFETLEDLGFECHEVYKLPKRGAALVAIHWKEKDTLSGHFVVWDSRRKQFLDPLHGVIGQRDMLRFAGLEHIWAVTKEKNVQDTQHGKRAEGQDKGTVGVSEIQSSGSEDRQGLVDGSSDNSGGVPSKTE